MEQVDSRLGVETNGRHTQWMTAKPLPALMTMLLLALAWSPANSAQGLQDRPMCRKLERDMDRLRSRMRHRYSARQGERYRSRMQRLKTRYYSRCRFVDR